MAVVELAGVELADIEIRMAEVVQQSCRSGCGACCIAPSITSAIPGMPAGKPAGIRCIQLTTDNYCLLFGLDSRPDVCSGFKAMADDCGNSDDEALNLLAALELATS